MSRRAKQLILALFLVLVGIILAGVILAWTPKNPLRFTLAAAPPTGTFTVTDPGTEVTTTEADYDQLTYLTVENTSGSTVLFYGGVVLPPTGSKGAKTDGVVGYLAPISDLISGERPASYDQLVIPPHGTTRCLVMLDEDSAKALLRKIGGDLDYQWSTKARIRWGNFCDWLAELLPEKASPFLVFEPIISEASSLEQPAK